MAAVAIQLVEVAIRMATAAGSSGKRLRSAVREEPL